MGREIKFRVWDKELYQYNSPNVHHLEKNDDVLSIVLNLDTQKICGDGRFVIQQYTGLKDKEGNDVYEGDILHMDMGIMYVVEWSDPHATFIFKTITNQEGMYMIPSGIVKTRTIVYGNIFENPELLNQ